MRAFGPHPRFRAEDTGLPVPHGDLSSASCLATIADCIGYLQRLPEIVERMETGYPRFFLHPKVKELFAFCEQRFAGREECCFAFPSRRAAERCASFVQNHVGVQCRLNDLHRGGAWVVTMPAEVKLSAMLYWQHSGEIISARQAVALLADRAPDYQREYFHKQSVRARISELTGTRREDVYLFSTGMAAIAAAYRMFQSLTPRAPSVQFGPPYVDLLKLQQRTAHNVGVNSGVFDMQATVQLGQSPLSPDLLMDEKARVFFFPIAGEAQLSMLGEVLRERRIMGIFCEVPGNPLLQTADLARLSTLARAHDVPLFVDDSIGAFVNIDASMADVVGTSLTKFFSGIGTVTGGSLVLNRKSPFYDRFKAILSESYEDLLFEDDARELDLSSRDVLQRGYQTNRTSEIVCDWLREQPEIERIYYPKYETPELYQRILKPGGGWGGLFSILLKDAERATPLFFDSLKLTKAPSFGTIFTTCCPYTLLAHFRELPFINGCGISTWLLRVSVGLEDPRALIEIFREALAETRKL